MPKLWNSYSFGSCFWVEMKTSNNFKVGAYSMMEIVQLRSGIAVDNYSLIQLYFDVWRKFSFSYGTGLWLIYGMMKKLRKE